MSQHCRFDASSPHRPRFPPERFHRCGVETARVAQRLLDEHRFRSLGKLVVDNLDRIAEVHNVGN
jgi:hypothetical protein